MEWIWLQMNNVLLNPVPLSSLYHFLWMVYTLYVVLWKQTVSHLWYTPPDIKDTKFHIQPIVHLLTAVLCTYLLWFWFPFTLIMFIMCASKKKHTLRVKTSPLVTTWNVVSPPQLETEEKQSCSPFQSCEFNVLKMYVHNQIQSSPPSWVSPPCSASQRSVCVCENKSACVLRGVQVGCCFDRHALNTSLFLGRGKHFHPLSLW